MSPARHRMTARRHRPDYSIVMVVGLLLLVGIVGLVSIGNALDNGITPAKQMISILVGVTAFSVTAFVPITFWHRIQGFLIWAAVIGSTLLLILPDAINPELNGAKRWINLGPLSFQPSELVKFALLIYFASFLAKRHKNRELDNEQATLVPSAIIMGVLGFVIMILQRDLGTMLVLLIMMLFMLYVAEVKMRSIIKVLGGIVALGALAILLVPHRAERFTTFLDPGSDIQGSGYHINQALIAVGSGGIFGNSLGGSVQAFGYLPEAANDSIFAVYAEMFGFAGVIVLLALFGVLLVKVIRVLDSSPNTYTKLLATGVFAWFFGHIVINIGAMLSLLPLTGITLPFLSYGGSSMLFMMAALGLVFNISRYTVYGTNKNSRRRSREDSDVRRRQRRPRYAH